MTQYYIVDYGTVHPQNRAIYQHGYDYDTLLILCTTWLRDIAYYINFIYS